MKKSSRALCRCRLKRCFSLTSFVLLAALMVCIAVQPVRAQGEVSSDNATAPPQPGQLASSQSPDQQDAKGMLALPNTGSAPPLTVRQKFHYRVIESFGLRGLGGAAISASIGQASGTPYAWGGGVEGFAKRYASSLAGNLSRQTFSFVIESWTHEDTRFFPSQDPSFKARVFNAARQILITKTDSNHTSFAYGRVISAFAAGQFVNAWQPATNGRVVDGLERGVFSLGGDFAFNLLQEVVPFARPKVSRHGP